MCNLMGLCMCARTHKTFKENLHGFKSSMCSRQSSGLGSVQIVFTIRNHRSLSICAWKMNSLKLYKGHLPGQSWLCPGPKLGPDLLLFPGHLSSSWRISSALWVSWVYSRWLFQFCIYDRTCGQISDRSSASSQCWSSLLPKSHPFLVATC